MFNAMMPRYWYLQLKLNQAACDLHVKLYGAEAVF